MNRNTIFWAAIVFAGCLLIVNGLRVAFGEYTLPVWLQVGDTLCLGLILVASGMEKLSPLRAYLKRKSR